MEKRLFERMNRLQRDIKRWSYRGIGRKSHIDKLARLKEQVDSVLEIIKQELGVAALEENLDLARNPYNRIWVDGKLVPHMEVEVTE